MFNPLDERVSLKELIASQIEAAILEKKYLPGSKLPSENELCKMFGVSRTSVREAVQIVKANGLVSIEKGRGIFVKSISSESVSNNILKFLEHRFEGDYFFDLIHARQIIEPGIAYFAALNRTEEDLIKLKNDVDQIAQNNDSSTKHLEYDMSFHMNLAYASQNKLLPLLVKPIHRLIPSVKSKILISVADAREAAIIWHTKIFENVKKRDADGAQQAMIDHLKVAEKHLEIVVGVNDKINKKQK